MPKLIGYTKADSFNPLISWLKQYKPNVKYTLKAEFTKNGKEYEVDCGALSSDPVLQILSSMLQMGLYSTGYPAAITAVTVTTQATGTSTNANSSTSWLSTSYTLNGSTSGNFTLKFSTTMSSSVGSATTVTGLSFTIKYGQNSAATPYNWNYNINTQGGTTACNVSVSSGTVVTWTLSGSVTESNTNATSSWYAMLWNEFWAEVIASTGVSGAPTGLWQYPAAGTSSSSNLTSYYTIQLSDSSGTVIGSYNSSTSSSTGISNVSINAPTNVTLTGSPSISFTYTPSASDTLNTATVIFYLNGTKPTSPYTALASLGGIQLTVTNIGQSVAAGEQYNITLTDNVSVSGNT